MKNIGVLALSLVLAISVSGCGKTDNRLEPTAAVGGAAANSTAPTEDLGDAAKYGLTVNPASASACPDAPRIVADVTWDVKEPMPKGIRIEVGPTTNPKRNILTQNRAKGSVSTGSWVSAGTTFYLIDESTNKQLAGVKVAAEPCAH
jgi:hypothetical protein